MATPGVQGVVTGTQGMGVRTPRATAVAAVTVGMTTARLAGAAPIVHWSIEPGLTGFPGMADLSATSDRTSESDISRVEA